MSHCTPHRARSSRASGWGLPVRLASAAALAISSIGAPTFVRASLAAPLVNEPPPIGHQIISFPARDFITANGYRNPADPNYDGPYTVTVKGAVVETGKYRELLRAKGVFAELARHAEETGESVATPAEAAALASGIA